jgi:hypothetical protein
MSLPKIYATRLALSQNGGSELAAKQSSDLDDIFQDIQNLLSEINAAKITALNEVDEKYKERLEELDSSYAMLLNLMSKNTPVNEEEE